MSTLPSSRSESDGAAAQPSATPPPTTTSPKPSNKKGRGGSGGGKSKIDWDAAVANAKLGNFDDIPSDLYARYRSNIHQIHQDSFTPYTGMYQTGVPGERVFQFEGESEDMTACDSECGYCGRCAY